MSSHPKIVVLDRDGVINYDSDSYIKSCSEWRPIEGSLEAISILKSAGFVVVIATNQSGIGRGYYTEKTLTQIHDKLSLLLSDFGCQLDGIVYCPHLPNENCECRKPKSGLLTQIEHQLDISLKNAWMVGDSLRDLQAGRCKDMRLVLVKTGKGKLTIKKGDLPSHTSIFDNLAAFAKFAVQEARQHNFP